MLTAFHRRHATTPAAGFDDEPSREATQGRQSSSDNAREDDTENDVAMEYLRQLAHTPPPRPAVPSGVNETPGQGIGAHIRRPPTVIDLTRDSPEPSGPRDPLGPSDFLQAGQYTSHHERTVFDLLSELPSDPLGNQASRVNAQQEDIFTRNELQIEDRVITALWTRWISLKRYVPSIVLVMERKPSRF